MKFNMNSCTGFIIGFFIIAPVFFALMQDQPYEIFHAIVGIALAIAIGYILR